MKNFLYVWIAVIIAGMLAYFSNINYCKTSTIDTEIVEDIEEVLIDNWDNFIEAVIWVESRGNENCIGDNGEAVGVLQIHPIMVREANRILKMQKIDKEYCYDDRYNREKSIEIFNIVQDFYNKNHDYNIAMQVWNKNHPESYRNDIMDKYNELIFQYE